MGELACAESDTARYAASKFEKIGAADVQRLDAAVAALEARGLKFDGWATPGANVLAATLDVARTTARRAERRLTSLRRTAAASAPNCASSSTGSPTSSGSGPRSRSVGSPLAGGSGPAPASGLPVVFGTVRAECDIGHRYV